MKSARIAFSGFLVAVLAVPPVQASLRMFGVTGAGSVSSTLFELDPNTGEVIATVGPTGFAHVTGLAFHPHTGVLYAVSNDTDGSGGRLLTIDHETGVASEIAAGRDDRIPDISFRSDGVLFAWSEASDDLYTVDLTTGALTLVGESGVGTAQTGLAFDYDDNLFMQESSNLYTVDTSTGMATALVDLTPSSTRNTLAFDSSGRAYTVSSDRSLARLSPTTGAVTSPAMLYGITGAMDAESILFTVDPQTGAEIATVGTTGVSHITAMDFDPSGTLWGISSPAQEGPGLGALWTIDPATGTASQVGSQHDHNVPDMSFRSDGTLFAWSETDDNAYTVDLTTAEFTLVGESGQFTLRTGLAFDQFDTLFMKADNSLYSVNQATGLASSWTTLSSSARNALLVDTWTGLMYTIDDARDLAFFDRNSGALSVVGGSSAAFSALAMRAMPSGLPQLSAVAVMAGPPTGELSVKEVVAGAAATVTAVLDDDSTVASACLLYRVGGTGPFQPPVAMTESSPGTWSAEIPATATNERGVQFYVEATDDAGAVGRVPPGAPGAGVASLPVSVSNRPTLELSPGKHSLAGIPLQANDVSPHSIFAQFGEYDRSVWRYGTYDPANDRYEELDESPPARDAVPGQGFWIVTRDGGNVAVSGQSSDLSRNFVMNLPVGWNQIASPFTFSVDFADVVLPVQVASNLVGWNGDSYIPGLQTLVPGAGYWIRNNGPGTQAIEIPPLGSGVTGRREWQAPGQIPEGEAGWSVLVQARAGEYTDDFNRFGMRGTGTDGRDTFDFADAPAPPGGHALVSFLNQETIHLMTDYRPEESEGERWELVLRSDQRGHAFQIEFALERQLPAGWELRAIRAGGAIEVDLLETATLDGVVASASQSWIVAAGPSEYLQSIRDELNASVTDLAFSAPFPNPTSREASFDLALPQRTEVVVRVYDVQGRRVDTLVRGGRDQGVHRVVWRGVDGSGRRVGSGVYFVRVQAGSFSETRRVVLLR